MKTRLITGMLVALVLSAAPAIAAACSWFYTCYWSWNGSYWVRYCYWSCR